MKGLKFMKRILLTTGVLGALVLPLLAAPLTADASCQGRATTGTVVGGVSGAVIGNSVSRGGGGAILGGLGGAVLGHEIGKSGCDDNRTYVRDRRVYHSRRWYRRHHVELDQYGNPR